MLSYPPPVSYADAYRAHNKTSPHQLLTHRTSYQRDYGGFENYWQIRKRLEEKNLLDNSDDDTNNGHQHNKKTKTLSNSNSIYLEQKRDDDMIINQEYLNKNEEEELEEGDNEENEDENSSLEIDNIIEEDEKEDEASDHDSSSQHLSSLEEEDLEGTPLPSSSLFLNSPSSSSSSAAQELEVDVLKNPIIPSLSLLNIHPMENSHTALDIQNRKKLQEMQNKDVKLGYPIVSSSSSSSSSIPNNALSSSSVSSFPPSSSFLLNQTIHEYQKQRQDLLRNTSFSSVPTSSSSSPLSFVNKIGSNKPSNVSTDESSRSHDEWTGHTARRLYPQKSLSLIDPITFTTNQNYDFNNTTIKNNNTNFNQPNQPTSINHQITNIKITTNHNLIPLSKIKDPSALPAAGLPSQRKQETGSGNKKEKEKTTDRDGDDSSSSSSSSSFSLSNIRPLRQPPPLSYRDYLSKFHSPSVQRKGRGESYLDNFSRERIRNEESLQKEEYSQERRSQHNEARKEVDPIVQSTNKYKTNDQLKRIRKGVYQNTKPIGVPPYHTTEKEEDDQTSAQMKEKEKEKIIKQNFLTCEEEKEREIRRQFEKEFALIPSAGISSDAESNRKERKNYDMYLPPNSSRTTRVSRLSSPLLLSSPDYGYSSVTPRLIEQMKEREREEYERELQQSREEQVEKNNRIRFELQRRQSVGSTNSWW